MKMNSVQELIDEHKDQMPTALAKKLLDACKAEADAKPRLYRLTMTRVTTVVHMEKINGKLEPIVKLEHLTQSIIVEAVSYFTFQNLKIVSDASLLKHCMVHESWLEMVMPIVDASEDDSMVIVHSIEPYVPKRGREE